MGRHVVFNTFQMAPAQGIVSADAIQRAIQGSAAAPSTALDQGTIDVRRTFVLGDDVGFMESDLLQLDATARPLSLGPGMMLTSQCITVLRHYLDLLAQAPP